MSLPSFCEFYPRKQLAETKVDYFQYRASPPEALRNGGFLIFDDRFLDIIGKTPSIELLLSDHQPLWHEACVYIPETGDIWVTSNHLLRGTEKEVQISRVKKEGDKYVNERLDLSIAFANGAVNYRDGVLWCEQGSTSDAGGLIYTEAYPPYKKETVISNFYGRWFNSVNDVVIAKDGAIWFTDPTYGFEQRHRPLPVLPNQVYRYDPSTGNIRAVADGIGKPNGLCFSPDEQTMYITDTDAVHSEGVHEPHRVASIYAYDVAYRHGSPFLLNRRLFAATDSLIPDGIKCDQNGNVYSGCGDGVHVWSPGGDLLGKIVMPGVCANFCFGREGEVFILNETKMWRAQLNTEVRGALLGL